MNHLQHLTQCLTRAAISICLISICCFPFGCQPQQPLYLTEKGRYQNHYLSKATKIEYTDVNVQSLSEVCNASAPLTLDNPDPDAMWDLTLEEAIQMALKNSKVVRTLSGVGFSQAGVAGAPGTLLQAPGSVRTVYDPALMESDPRYGPEAALAAFDAQLTAGARWIKSDTPYRANVNPAGNPPWYNNTAIAGVQGDTGQFDIGINKYAATGTQFYLTHANQYNVGGPQSTPVTWSSYLEGGFRHPLLRGSGIEFNRIAGPSGQPGVYAGVAVARINTDQSLNDFEMAVRNLVADVEKAYWNLYYAYHRLDSVRTGFGAAHRTWQQTKNFHDVGGERGRAQYLAQAERNLFQFRSQMEIAQNNLFKAEAAMRYIVGLAASDGRLIRPIDDPVTAPIRLDYQNILCEALFRSPELRKQKWEVKRRELELCASKNFLLPRLDLDAGYRISGAGKNLTNGSSSSAYGSLGSGDYTGWSLGLTASAPFGWRQELAGVRHAEHGLAKARVILQEQELELTHQLNDSFREISLAYQQMQTTLASRRSAEAEVRAVYNAYEGGITTLDQYLQAQKSQADAETSYYSSVIDYNLAIMTLHYRKGSLLEYNNVCLTEGQWPGKAYFDAKRRARERDAGHYFNYGFTLPRAVSRGTYPQHQHGYNSTAYETLPTIMPRGGGEEEIMAPVPNGAVIETDSIMMIPTPILPKSASNSSGNTPVSFVTPDVGTPNTVRQIPTLTPARNMRYVTK